MAAGCSVINIRLYLKQFPHFIFKNFRRKLHHASTVTCFAMHISRRPTNFLMPSEKMCLVEHVATDAPLFSRHHMKIVFSLKLI
jgi:hypothetical protein